MSSHANLRQFLEAHVAGTTLVPVNDAGMLLDMDTPEDYARIQQRSGEER
jgi:CTP:molybdopterin cytidylyltransferase MocA